jgi:hypothetical protein
MGAAAANRNQPAFSGGEGAAAGYASVRNNVDHPGVYGNEWYGNHPTAWHASGWAAGAAYAPTTWGAVATTCGYNESAPTSYNYGVNVTCEGDNVAVNGQNVGTAAEYSQQASDIAGSGADATTADADQWLPLGVYAMVRNEQQHPQLIVQLAVNQNGTIRGNYTDQLTDHTQPIQGAVDKATERAAWTVGDNHQTVMEAGINDLTGGEASALVHRNGKSDHWLLVRLNQPEAGAASAE